MRTVLPYSRTIAASLSVLVSVACGASQPWELTPRPARDLPEQFVIDTSVIPVPLSPDGGCVTRMLDPRNGTRLTLVRSTRRTASPEFLGDYTVDPVGRYGVSSGSLLRVDCTTGRAMGIV
ncbi:MAG TPA: hypothetical protein VFO06_07080 [Gemmatimonadales bacterium]|nr:hypothetical protein [Gemmatimonadales bacterium]